MLVQTVNQWLALRLDVLGGMIGFLIGAFAMASKDSSFAIPAGWVGLALNYSIELTGYLKFGVRMIAQTEADMSSVERILYYSTNVKSEAPSDVPDSDPAPGSWPTKGAITFKNASMRYRDGPLVLKGVSLDFKAGERVGICGRTGSGKSSMMISLFRYVTDDILHVYVIFPLITSLLALNIHHEQINKTESRRLKRMVDKSSSTEKTRLLLEHLP